MDPASRDDVLLDVTTGIPVIESIPVDDPFLFIVSSVSITNASSLRTPDSLSTTTSLTSLSPTSLPPIVASFSFSDEIRFSDLLFDVLIVFID